MGHQETVGHVWTSRMSPRTRDLLYRIAGPLLFTFLYVVTLFWFAVVDVYHSRFFHVGHGQTYLAYNVFRVLFIMYIACMFYYVGRCLLRSVEHRPGAFRLNLPDEFVLCFFSGAAVTAFFLFALGFLHLYYRVVAGLITIPLVALAYPAVADYATRISAGFRRIWVNDRNPARSSLKWVSLGCVGFLAILLLIMKGLPPRITGDYCTHYFPYFDMWLRPTVSGPTICGITFTFRRARP